MACVWLVYGLGMTGLWPDHGLDVDSPGIESGTVLCPVCGMIVCLVMVCGVDWFKLFYGLA